MWFGVLMSKFRAMVLGREKRKYLEKARSDLKPQIPWGSEWRVSQWEVSLQVSEIWYTYSEAAAHKIYP
jgi:hypothetical protein